jgi:hypothetical protein
MSANAINSLGLILDMIGVCVLFKFGFPQPDLGDHINIVAEGKDPDAPKRRRLYVGMSLLGLVCLVGGFGLQLGATWLR